MNPENIIQEILKNFDQLVENKQHEAKNWTTQEWTTEVKTALCKAGQELGCLVWANGVDKQYTEGGEYLYDVSCLKYNKTNLLKSAPIVAECEWGTRGAVKDDFEKTLLARATVRVMVFDGMRCENGTEAFASEICGWVGAFEGNQKGDTYLLVGYERDEISWRFRYFIILVNESDQQPTLTELQKSKS